jgi:putative addiction module killer protein
MVDSIPERKTQFRIGSRLRRLTLGHTGDSRSVGEGVLELRLDFGTGYRVYFHKRGEVIVLLLTGGTKSKQDRDIAKAKQPLHDWEV